MSYKGLCRNGHILPENPRSWTCAKCRRNETRRKLRREARLATYTTVQLVTKDGNGEILRILECRCGSDKAIGSFLRARAREYLKRAGVKT